MRAALELKDIVRLFSGPGPGRKIAAVNGVSLTVRTGETVALVGESGSGKSTLGRIAVRLDRPDRGTVEVNGRDITHMSSAKIRPLRAQMQMVFQDPWGTLNPRQRIGSAIVEPLLFRKDMNAASRKAAISEIAVKVRLEPEHLDRFPSELSGGQLQRVAIARALINRPALVVLDEPTSSLDLSVRAEILALLASLQREMGAGYLLITHDLGSVRMIAHRIAVLYCGNIVEEGPADTIFSSSRHPYTRMLFSAELSTYPDVSKAHLRLEGDIPSPMQLPAGCAFSGRCPMTVDVCRVSRPPLTGAQPHRVACFRSDEALLFFREYLA